MKNWSQIRERYLRDGLPIRLGGLAANLSRIKSFAASEASRETVENLIDESKMFIEWTAAQADMNTAQRLVELQIQLARWQLQWQIMWPDEKKRNQLAEQASTWSQQVLQMSGLLNR
jgi:hypothetical protein